MRIHIEVDDEVHRQAKAEASLDGLTLKAWVIDAMRDKIEGRRVPGDDREVAPGSESSSGPEIDETCSTDPPTLRPVAPAGRVKIVCTHPKAALVHLSGGLARCGACGVNRKADGSWPT